MIPILGRSRGSGAPQIWTPPGSTPPPPPSDAPDPDVWIGPGDSWQTELNSAGTGAVIGLEPGTYSGFAVNPLTNQKFVADTTAVTLDGNGAGECFGGHGTRGIEIWGEGVLTITDYDPSIFHGAICSLGSDWYDNPDWAEGGWLVDNVLLDGIQGHGAIILDGNDCIIRHTEMTDIGEIGFKIIFGHDGHVHDCEISYITPADWGNEGGASKCWGTRNLVHEDIYVHHITDGPGLWTDMDNIDTVYRRITTDNVDISNIFHEISGPVLVEDCELTGDGSSHSNGIWSRSGGGIHIVNSGDDGYGGTWDGAIVRNNTLEDFYVGIGFLDQDRTDQFSQDRKFTTEGDVYDNILDNCDNNGDARDHNGDQYVLGALPVDWHEGESDENTLLNGSTIN